MLPASRSAARACSVNPGEAGRGASGKEEKGGADAVPPPQEDEGSSAQESADVEENGARASPLRVWRRWRRRRRKDGAEQLPPARVELTTPGTTRNGGTAPSGPSLPTFCGGVSGPGLLRARAEQPDVRAAHVAAQLRGRSRSPRAGLTVGVPLGQILFLTARGQVASCCLCPSAGGRSARAGRRPP